MGTCCSIHQSPDAQLKRRRPLCHLEQLNCPRQLEREMTPAIATDARPGEPALSLSRGRPPNVSPPRKGWGINPEEDPSAVGAALCHPERLRLYERSREPALTEAAGSALS